ncbi:unnamed protein product [Caenorhabditis angaria]|uniref:Uncharacterized protein n=1 Tax=Caenorhabditis angaria TaxID=860376 RepID=A0A9P1IPD7_9PELO|nr:unnamed protein product [Caenorhabditis angaria]
MEKFEMIAVRRRLGKILLVTIDGSKSEEISELNLNKFYVSLGDFCMVTFEDGLIFKINKIDNHKSGIRFKPSGPNTIGEGVFARIRHDGSTVYFDSPMFGRMNCLDQIDSSLWNTSQNVEVWYQDGNDGINLPFKWTARIAKNIVNQMNNMSMNNEPQSSSSYSNSYPNQDYKSQKPIVPLKPSFENSKLQNHHYPDTAAVTQLAKNHENKLPPMVPWSKTFGPQKLPMLKPQQLKKSEFEEESKTHQITGIVVFKFPKYPSRFYVWTKDSYPGTDVTLMSSGEDQVNVTDWIRMNLTKTELEKHFPIKPNENTPPFTCHSFTKLSNQILKTGTAGKSVMITIPHLNYEGGDIRNEHLGLIADPEGILNTKGVYKQIKVVRKVPNETVIEKRTVWKIISAQIKKEENKMYAKVQPNKPKEIKPKFEVHRKKYVEKGADETLCRGVVTSIKKINGVVKYYCWLIDKHDTSVIHDPTLQMINGDFFESNFKQNKYGRWIHINQSSIERIDRLLNYDRHFDTIKFVVNVSTSDITYGEPTQIHHEYFGNIIDIWNKVSENEPDGSSIQLEIIQHSVSGTYHWVVFNHAFSVKKLIDGSKSEEISELNLNKFHVSLGDFCMVTFEDGLIFKINKIDNHKSGIRFKPSGPNTIGEGVFARVKHDGFTVYFDSPMFGRMNSLLPIGSSLWNTSQNVEVWYQDGNDGINLPFKWTARLMSSKNIVNQMNNININNEPESSSSSKSHQNRDFSIYQSQKPIFTVKPNFENSKIQYNYYYPGTAAVTQLSKNYENKTPPMVSFSQTFGPQKPPKTVKPQQMKKSEFEEESKTQQIIGIVVHKFPKYPSRCYVWTRNAYPGHDMILMNSGEDQINVTDWIRMNLTKTELEKHFPIKPNENTPQFTCRSFTKLSNQILKTENVGKSIFVTIPRIDYDGGDIRNEHLGLISDPAGILNTKGVYKQIKVVRKVPNETVIEKRAVWKVISAQHVKEEENKMFARVHQNKPKKLEMLKKRYVGKNMDETVCRAVITSIKTINGVVKYYCWLIDKHVTSVIHDPQIQMLNGDFFESKFKQNKHGRWNHTSESSIERIDRLMDFEKHHNTIKFVIEVSTSHIAYGEPTQIHHEYFGNIIDIFNKISDNESDGYTIKLEIIQHSVNGTYCWVVSVKKI